MKLDITHINFGKEFRGGQRQTLELIKELSKRGYKQTLVLRVKSLLIHKCENINNLKIIQLKKPYILYINKIKNSSILHAHETKALQFSYFVNLIYKIPYIVTRRVDNGIKNNFFNKNIYSKASFCISLSKVIENSILKLTNLINSKIIPDSYTTYDINQSNINKIKNRFKNKFMIGSIGELDNLHKGQYYLIQACKKLQITHPFIHTILLGRGKDLQNYKNQSKDLTNITFEGFVNNIGDYIKCFDIFIYPSLHEGLGSSLLDIMRQKVPIIASNVGGIPDIIKHHQNGLLIESKNSDDIYNSIIYLYENQNISNQLILNAYNNSQDYSIENITNKYISLYKSI
jgi:glycosyltransferase involved in cell wall biosynthesis